MVAKAQLGRVMWSRVRDGDMLRSDKVDGSGNSGATYNMCALTKALGGKIFKFSRGANLVVKGKCIHT